MDEQNSVASLCIIPFLWIFSVFPCLNLNVYVAVQRGFGWRWHWGKGRPQNAQVRTLLWNHDFLFSYRLILRLKNFPACSECLQLLYFLKQNFIGQILLRLRLNYLSLLIFDCCLSSWTYKLFQISTYTEPANVSWKRLHWKL